MEIGRVNLKAPAGTEIRICLFLAAGLSVFIDCDRFMETESVFHFFDIDENKIGAFQACEVSGWIVGKTPEKAKQANVPGPGTQQ